MADGHAKPEHDYHLVDPSPWPIVGALAALVTAIGAIMWMAQHKGAPIGGMTFGGTMFFVGLGGILLRDVRLVERHHPRSERRRIPHAGRAAASSLRDDPVHLLGGDVLRRLVLGLLQFRRSSRPIRRRSLRTELFQGVWPPKGIEVLSPWKLPLLNTLILLSSGATLTWAHHGLLQNKRDVLKKGLIATIALGLLFTTIQAYEYPHAPFAFAFDPAKPAATNYGSTFFMATGFHGFHVIVGTIFLIVCLLRVFKGALHAGPAFGLRIRRLVLALRRRRLAVSVRLHLRVGELGRDDGIGAPTPV